MIIYFHFENPIVIYSKDNDKSTNRTFLLKDTLLLFFFVEPTTSSFKSINRRDVFFESINVEINSRGNYIMKALTLVPCEFGINLDTKYKEFIDELGSNELLLNESFCISQEQGDFSLYYQPDIGYNELHFYITINNKSKINPQKTQAIIISENNIMVHSNKSNPIFKTFVRQITPNFAFNEYTIINYDMQYVKYESDNGLIFQAPTILNAKSFSSMNYYRNIRTNEYNSLRLGEIIISINKSNFDKYSRTYTKLQTLITEIYTIINLFFNIGRIIIKILLEKRMSIDIIRSLFNKENIVHEKNNPQIPSHQNKKINKLFKNIEKNKISSLELIKLSAKSEEKGNTLKSLEQITKDNIKNKTINRNSINESYKILKQINIINIIKSFLCCKDKRSTLINACHNLIIDNISIENILKELYKLENAYYILLQKSKHKIKKNIYDNKRLREINKCIYEINKELKMPKKT